jgi:hypothetical protein
MRVSTNKNDVGYLPDSRDYQVTLDGMVLKDCITADEERGTVLMCLRTDTGGLAHTADGRDLLTGERKGLVKISGGGRS